MHARNASYGGFSSYNQGSGAAYGTTHESGFAQARRTFGGDEMDDVEAIEGGSTSHGFGMQGWATTGEGINSRKLD